MSEPLLDQVLRELNACRGEWPRLCRELGLSYWWITKLAQGHIHDPGVRKIQRLHDYFVANEPKEAA